MRTTAGKTGPAFPKEPRWINIGRFGHEELEFRVEAKSLRVALETLFIKQLQPKGWSDPLFNGNTLSVYDPDNRLVTYVATDQPSVETRFLDLSV